MKILRILWNTKKQFLFSKLQKRPTVNLNCNYLCYLKDYFVYIKLEIIR